MVTNTPTQGQQQPTSQGSEFNTQEFLVNQLIGRLATSTLVQVKKVTPPSDPVGAVGTVDVQPMVSQIDGAGNATPHGTIYGIPYFRLQGGVNAIVLDPKIGDIGLAVFCSRDISAVKSTKKVAPPGSRRRYDWADGIYIGGCLNVTPTQYIIFRDDNGIEIHSPKDVKITCATAEINASTSVTVTSPTSTFNGNVIVNGDLTVNGP